MKISLVMPSTDNRYFRWAYNSIQKNKGNHEVFICALADNCSDDSNQYFAELAKKDDHFSCIINDTGKRWGISVGYNKIIKELVVKTDICMIFHNDMYLMPGALDAVERNISKKTIVSLTRIEPPIYPPLKEKLIINFGEDLETFDENKLLAWYDENKNNELYKNKITNGIFAPWAIYKSEFDEIGGHDECNFGPVMYEDSDIFQRLILNGCDTVQPWNGFVYHLTSRSWKHKNGAYIELSKEENDYFADITNKNVRNFLRKWGSEVYSDNYLHPHIINRYDIGVVASNLTENTLNIIEVYADTVYSDLDYTNYIDKEQKRTPFDLTKKLKKLTDNINNDIIIEFDANMLDRNDIISYFHLRSSIQEINAVGDFEYSIFKVHVRKNVDYKNHLIKLNDPWFLNKLLK